MRQTSRLVYSVNWIWKPKIYKAFIKLRKEGYRCRQNLNSAEEYNLRNCAKLIYYRKRLASKSYFSPIKFFYTGDFDPISNILEAEGLRIGYVSWPRQPGYKQFFCLLQTNPKTGEPYSCHISENL
jgi:hypothetical protein